MIEINEDLEIGSPIETVFATLTDINALPLLSPDVSAVTSDAIRMEQAGQIFSATKTIHNRAQVQDFRVIAFDRPEHLEIQTTLFKLPVIYSYRLTPVGEKTTLVQLRRSATLTGWTLIFTPLLRHLFTKPEHDQFHLQRLAAECERRREKQLAGMI